jgi:hydrogenase 3 maturation protease
MKDLYGFLIERLKDARKLVILGAGSFMKADDAAGVMVTEKLKESFDEAVFPSVRIYTGESAPENYTGEIKKFKPDHLLLLDAADMQEAPGSIVFIQPEVIGGVSFSTHMLPVKIMLDYLVKETGCGITIIGIQPEDLTYDGKVTPKVIETVDYITEVLKKVISM